MDILGGGKKVLYHHLLDECDSVTWFCAIGPFLVTVKKKKEKKIRTDAFKVSCF